MKRSKSGTFLGLILILIGLVWGLYVILHRASDATLFGTIRKMLDGILFIAIGLIFLPLANKGKSAKYLATKVQIGRGNFFYSRQWATIVISFLVIGIIALIIQMNINGQW